MLKFEVYRVLFSGEEEEEEKDEEEDEEEEDSNTKRGNLVLNFFCKNAL